MKSPKNWISINKQCTYVKNHNFQHRETWKIKYSITVVSQRSLGTHLHARKGWNWFSSHTRLMSILKWPQSNVFTHTDQITGNVPLCTTRGLLATIKKTGSHAYPVALTLDYLENAINCLPDNFTVRLVWPDFFLWYWNWFRKGRAVMQMEIF